ncbi:MAG TPA: hypothetical protein VFJ74_02835 [Gemmatimonadaceae bacterium]|nr:hypothetical protein [Gemmatimonadaceae bacterium]
MAAASAATRPTAADRVRDAIALALLAVGGVLFFYARFRLQQLAANHITRVQGHAAEEQFWYYYRMSYVGAGVAAAGLAAALTFAFLRSRRVRRLASHTISSQS